MSYFATVILCLATFSVGLCTFVFIWPLTEHTTSQVQNESAFVISNTKSIIPKEKETIVTPLVYTKIYFVGDVMMARNVENIMQSYGASYPFSYLPKVASTSYLVGNFEASVPKIHTPTQSMGFSFSVKSDYIEQLKAYGFTHMGLANNHSYDFGSDDFLHTVTTLQNENLNPFGDQRNQASSTVVYLDLQNTTVGVIGVFAVDVAPSDEVLQRLVTNVAKESDIQIAYVHFGTEYATVHSLFQEKLAQRLIDLGVDVVIGHHPHVVQDIQLYKGKPIFYSLGNFLFDQYFSQAVQEGLQLGLKVESNEIQIELLPVTSIGSRSAPRRMGGAEKAEFFKALAKKSNTQLGVMIEKGLIVVPR